MMKSQLDRWSRWIILAAFHGLVIGVPFIFTWVNEELFEFNKMVLTYGLTALIVGAWLTRMVAHGRFLWRRTPFDWVMAGFVASQIWSTFFSIDFHTSVFGYYTRFHGGLLSTLTYTVLFYAAVTHLTRRDLRALTLSGLVAAAGISLYAIPEHFGHSPSCWLISGGQVFDTSCWVQDVKSRVFATFGQPNWLAAYVITLLPLVTVVAASVKHTWRWLSLGLIAVLALTLLFTQSRSGVVGLALGLGWLTLMVVLPAEFASKYPKALTAVKAFWPSAALIAVVALLVGTPYTPSIATVWRQLNPTPEVATPLSAASPAPVSVGNRLDEGGTDSGEIRKIVWEGALKVWQRYPLFGSGVETFAYSYYQDRPVSHNLVSEWDFLYNKAHNEFLNFLATTGALGLLTYVALLGWFSLYTTYQALSNSTDLPPHQRWLLHSLVAGIVGLSVSNFFGFSTVMVTILLYLFMAGSVILTSKEQPVANHSSDTLSLTEWAALTVTIGLSVWMLHVVNTMWWADYLYAQGKLHVRVGYVVQGLEELQMASEKMPQEALFHDELAMTYAQLAVQLASQEGAAEQVKLLHQGAIERSNRALQLNSRHLNFYKTRAKVFFTLAAFDLKYLEEAKRTIEQAQLLSPTDAKLVYNLALAEDGLGQTDQAIATLRRAIELKPNYDTARAQLAQLLISKNDLTAARAEYEYIVNRINPNDTLTQQRLEELEASISAQQKTSR